MAKQDVVKRINNQATAQTTGGLVITGGRRTTTESPPPPLRESLGDWRIGAVTIAGHNLMMHADGWIQAGQAGVEGGPLVRIDATHEDYRLWAGALDPTAAPFRVNKDGALFASDADIAGAITADSGTIGGWEIHPGWLIADSPAGSTYLYADGTIALGGHVAGDLLYLSATNPDYRIWAGHPDTLSAAFKVHKDGRLFATNADIEGAITAGSGSIEGILEMGVAGEVYSASAYRLDQDGLTLQAPSIMGNTAFVRWIDSLTAGTPQNTGGVYNWRVVGTSEVWTELRAKGTAAETDAVVRLAVEGAALRPDWDFTLDSRLDRAAIRRDATDLLTLSSAGLLDIAGQIKIQGGSPGVNKVLTSDAAGLATWETVGAASGAVMADGSVALTAPWDAGNYITATRLGVHADDYLSRPAANVMRVALNASARFDFGLTYFRPAHDNLRNLGGASNRWATIYGDALNLSGQANIDELLIKGVSGISTAIVSDVNWLGAWARGSSTHPHAQAQLSAIDEFPATGITWDVLLSTKYDQAQIRRHDSGVITTALHIDDDLNTGIGTIYPGSRLTVEDAVSGADVVADFRNTENAEWAGTFRALAPNLGTGRNVYMTLGRAASTNNQATINFHYAGSGESSNRLEFGFYDNDGVFQVLADETVAVKGDRLRIKTAKTPASASAAGNAGDICWDSDYVYVCTATDTWKRAAIATW